MSDLFAEGIDATVKPEIREVVEAIKALLSKKGSEVLQKDLVKAVGLDKSAVSRRVKVAIFKGYVINKEEGKGKPNKLVLGEPMPADQELFPRPEKLIGDCEQLHGCAVEQGLTAPPLRHTVTTSGER